MELRHFRYLIAVAEELSFARAAERLNISQPPLSQQIRAIEEELGVQLFERTTRQVRLTEAGIRLVEGARKVLAEVEKAARAASDPVNSEDRLSIGMVFENTILVESLRLFGKQYPNIHIELDRLTPPEQMELLRQGRLQLGLTFVGGAKDPTLAYETLDWEHWVVGVTLEHHFTNLRTVPLRALASEPLIMFSGAKSELVPAFRKAGLSPHVVHEVNSVYSALALVMAGLGIGLFSNSTGDIERKGIVFREIAGNLPKLEYGAAYRREAQTYPLRVFLDIVRQIAKKKRPSTR